MQTQTPDARIAAAIDRVLEAEHATATAIADAQAAAQADIEAARERRRVILETARERVVDLHERAQRRLEETLQALDVAAPLRCRTTTRRSQPSPMRPSRAWPRTSPRTTLLEHRGRQLRLRPGAIAGPSRATGVRRRPAARARRARIVRVPPARAVDRARATRGPRRPGHGRPRSRAPAPRRVARDGRGSRALAARTVAPGDALAALAAVPARAAETRARRPCRGVDARGPGARANHRGRAGPPGRRARATRRSSRCRRPSRPTATSRQAWLAHWRALVARRCGAKRGLERLRDDVTDATLRPGGTRAAGEQPRNARARSTAGLLRAFRRHPLSPVAAVAFLGLEALDQLDTARRHHARVALAEKPS